MKKIGNVLAKKIVINRKFLRRMRSILTQWRFLSMDTLYAGMEGRTLMMTAPICPYCNKPSRLVNGLLLYGRRDLEKKFFYECAPCRAHVGCHPGSKNPLGRLADKALRDAKQETHAAFDPLWLRACAEGLSRKKARDAAYKWLTLALGIAREDCHIGMFDLELCRRATALCRTRPEGTLYGQHSTETR